jgi:hypothetical protein
MLNTNQIHSVEGIEGSTRYLITYGFTQKFENIVNKFRIKSY